MNVVLVDRAVKMSGQNLSFLGWMDLSCMQLKTCVFWQCGNSWKKKHKRISKGYVSFSFMITTMISFLGENGNNVDDFLILLPQLDDF